jgi:DNA-binding MarR family transcriptional regulator
MAEDLVLSILRSYPQIYHACHLEHPRARTNPGRISARDTWILGHLDLEHPLGPARLARHLALRPSTVSEAVRRLERLGYVTRRPVAADRRRIELRLTARGAEAMRGASVLDPGRVERLLAELPRPERARAVGGLARLAAAARSLQAKSR